jgi:toluene monooxygenase system ferredoxin subunit
MMRPDRGPDREKATWTAAIRLDDLWEGEMIGVRVGDGEVLLVNLGNGEIHAYDNRCPHAGSRLSEGRLEQTRLQCRAHLWEFDLRSGDGLNPKSCKLRRYAVRIVDGVVMVRAAPETSAHRE